MSHKWRLQLCQNDATMTAIGELDQARNRSLELLLNRPGSCSFDLPLDNEMAYAIQGKTTCIRAYRDNICRWSGPVWGIEDQLPSKTRKVTAVGWYEELNHRVIEDFDPRQQGTPPLPANQSQEERAKWTSATDAGLIGYGLLGLANEQRTDSGILVPTGVNAGTRDVSQNRTRSYPKFSNIGQGIQELTEIEAGFDMSVDPSTRLLNIHYQLIKAGSGLYGKGTDRPNTVFSIGWGPNNLRSFTRTVDVSQMRNRIVVGGRFSSHRAGDDASQLAYGIFEEQVSLSEITDATILTAFAIAEVAIRKTPRVIYSMAPFPWSQATEKVPRLFVDYDIGDIVYVTAVGGALSVLNQATRIFGVTMNINNEGLEDITGLQTAPN